MSAAPSVALPHAPPAAAVAGRPAGGSRMALLFAVILVTGVSAFAISAVSAAKPIGDGDSLPGYAAIASQRGYVWAFFVVAGVQLVVGACAAALAAMFLARDRGARWATVGGSLVWLGAAVYGVGIGGWATLYYFGTDPAVLDGATATRLIEHANDDTVRLLAVPIGGALLVGLGSLALSVALWRARTVPRWVPVVGAVGAVATIVLPPSGLAGLIAEAASSATTIAIGWYAWRRSAVAVTAPQPAL
jgi:Domain of unknown function (DUF4386)